MMYTGAYLIRGGEAALEAVLNTLEKDKVMTRHSPDVFARGFRSFGVEDAADVRVRARTKPIAGPQRVFVLFVPSITVEAQNALLKTLEEPVADALFFIISPAPEMLLPTIRSRTQVLTIPAKASSTDADVFLRADPAERLELLKPLYQHEDEGRDLGSVIAFLGALERRFLAAKRTPENRAGIAALYRARAYVADRGSLLKTLLEQLALLAPKM